MEIITVKEYNEKQAGMNMKFLTSAGNPRTTGFVVCHNNENIFCATRAQANQITEKDFINEECPIWFNQDCGISNLEYINS